MRVASTILFLLLAVPASAQVPFSDRDCFSNEVLEDHNPSDYSAEWAVRHPNAVFERLGPTLEKGRWGAVGTALADEFRASDLVPAGRHRDRFQTELDSAAAELSGVEGDAERIRKADGVEQERFHIDRNDLVLFGPGSDAIDMDDLEDAARRDLCWRAITMGRVLSAFGEEGRDVAVRALEGMLLQWDRFNEHSYSQYPWELLANGLLRSGGRINSLDDLAPPAWQLVALHPGVALEAGGFEGLDDLSGVDVLALELLGALFYNARRTNYVGVSAALSIPAEGGAGFGPMLHLGRRAQIGYVWRGEGATRGNGVIFSVDLFGMVSGVPSKLQNARDRVEATLQALGAAGSVE